MTIIFSSKRWNASVNNLRCSDLGHFCFIWAWILVSLIGCATTPVTTQHSDQNDLWQKHQGDLTSLVNWQVNGRFSAQKDNEAWHGSLYWQQRGDQYEIQLRGPFGQGAIRLQGDHDVSELYLSEQESYLANDAESLLATHTGLTLPVAYLQHWIRGLPSPLSSTQSLTKNVDGHVETLNQAGWQIVFKSYVSVDSSNQSLSLPRKLFLENQTFDVRLVIQKWQLEV